MKETYVTEFANYKSKNGKIVNLWEWLNNSTYKSKVEEIRKIEDKNIRSQIKSTLPAITISGTFSERKSSALIEHSGYICIDIDSNDNPEIKDFNYLKDEIKKIKNVAYASLSVSGNGIFCLIPIKHTDKHKMHFEALKSCFEELGIIIDKACSDVSRLRGYSYDENAYYNPTPEIFNKYLDLENTTKKQTPIFLKNLKPNNTDKTYNRVFKLAQTINISGIDITEKYEQWFQIGCALANEFGEEGRELFHIISANHPKYHEGNCDNMYSKCITNNYDYSIGTFFHWANHYSFF